MDPSPAIGWCLAISRARFFQGFCSVSTTNFNSVQLRNVGWRVAPGLGRRLLGWFWGRGRSGKNWRVYIFRVHQDRIQGIWGIGYRGRKFLRAVQRFAAYIWAQAVGLQVLTLLGLLLQQVSILLVRFILVPTDHHDFAQEVILSIESKLRSWNVGLTLKVPFQLQACLKGRNVWKLPKGHSLPKCFAPSPGVNNDDTSQLPELLW